MNLLNILFRRVKQLKLKLAKDACEADIDFRERKTVRTSVPDSPLTSARIAKFLKTRNDREKRRRAR